MGHWVKEILRLFQGIATPTGKRTVWGGLGGRGLDRLCRTCGTLEPVDGIGPSAPERREYPRQPYLSLRLPRLCWYGALLLCPRLALPSLLRLISDATIPGRSGIADLASPPARAAAAKADSGVSCVTAGAPLDLRTRLLPEKPLARRRRMAHPAVSEDRAYRAIHLAGCNSKTRNAK